MLKATKHNWKKIIEEWPQSDLSVSGYCRNLKIPNSSFYQYRKRFDLRPAEKKSPERSSSMQPKFVDITPKTTDAVSASPTIKIVTNSGHIMEIFL